MQRLRRYHLAGAGLVASACLIQRAEIVDSRGGAGTNSGGAADGGRDPANGGKSSAAGTSQVEGGNAGEAGVRGVAGEAGANEPTAGTGSAGETNQGGSSGGTAAGGSSGGTAAGSGGMAAGGKAGSGGMAGAGGKGGAGGTGGNGGSGGTSATGPSCDSGTASICNGESCCARGSVSGGNFTLGGGVEATTGSATVASFSLDKYEATVGRFRHYVDGFTGAPAAGAGLHPKVANSGWNASWPFPANTTELLATLKCSATYQTYTDAFVSDAREQLPMNCVNWYVAFAFCAWDGGRLPTEAEWEYAATGGPNAYAYPWGAPSPTASYANYDCTARGGCSFSSILAVGSKPLGKGLYQQYDLAGSLWEWALDTYAAYPATCLNCANVTAGTSRVLRGGSFFTTPAYIVPKYRSPQVPDVAVNVRQYSGVRCAHDP